MLRKVMCVLVLGWMMPLMAADYRVGDRLPGGTGTGAGTTGYREIQWEDLMPKGWDPAAAFKGIDLSRMQDGDPRADELLAKARAEWDKAPVELSMNGKRIRMPGFVVPLERKGDLVSEFLLVPYYGACIHVPPPPANQVVHVIPRKPVKGMLTMGAFWISGTISLHSGDSAAGVYGYRLAAEHIEKYDWDREKKK